jgi:dihydroneopterin aldolase
METTICINHLQLYAFHGVLQQEHSVGNHYNIDCKITVDVSRAMQTDEVADTINYAEAVEMISDIMKRPAHLLEFVAGRIIDALQERWPNIQHIDLCINKENPPIAHADVESCGIRVTT